MGNKIDITSTALEKGIDLAKDFLDKLIIPSVEETGLLLKDKVTFWKFKNQVKILNKAKMFCEKHNVAPKTISLKLLCPLLDYSALEEDEVLQDKWAILLSNMVDSEQNIENHVFPYILSQISSNEFSLLESVYDDQVLRKKRISEDLEQFRTEKPIKEKKLKTEISELVAKIETKLKEGVGRYTEPVWDWEQEKTKLERVLKSLEYKESGILRQLREPQNIPEEDLKEFEISNLTRLGLIRYIQRPYAHSQTLEIPYEAEPEYHSGYHNIDLEVEIESDEEYILTELGELFVNACKEKV